MSRLVAQRTPSGPPAISSVLPPPMSDTRTVPSGGCAEVTPRKVIRASSSPVSTRVVNPYRRSTSARNSAPLLASRTALVAVSSTTSAPFWFAASA